MRNDQLHQRGGMPLEVGSFTPLMGPGSSSTLDQTVAFNNKVLYGSLVTLGGAAVAYVGGRWLKDWDRERKQRVAVRDLTGESPIREHHSKQQMPGSTIGMGALSSSCSSDTKTPPPTVKKRRQRAPSKSAEEKPRSESRNLSQDDLAAEKSLVVFENLTSKLKSVLPSISTNPQGHQGFEERPLASTKNDEKPTKDDSDIERAGVASPSAAEEPLDAPSGPSMSAAERKKAKRKQNRANRRRQAMYSPPSPLEVPHSSPEGSTPFTSSSLTLRTSSESQPKAKPGSLFSRKTQLVDSDRTDTESATPTATTHPTPRAKSKSKMESVVQEQGRGSPSRSRTPSVASSIVSTTDERRESNDSAPSLSHTISPPSESRRLGSISSVHPLTPAPVTIGLNLLDAELNPIGDYGRELEWEQVGSSGKPKKKKKRNVEALHDLRGSSASPPASSVSPLSTASNILPSIEVLSTQTTDATSASWISDHPPCPDCERRKQEDIERSESAARSNESTVAALAAISKQLQDSEREEKLQRELVRSLTSTNTSLADKLDHMRSEMDSLQTTAESATSRARELEKALAKQREDLTRASAKPASGEKKSAKEMGSGDWKKMYDALSVEFNEHKFKNARTSEDLQMTIARQAAHIQEMTRAIQSYQSWGQQFMSNMIPNGSLPFLAVPPNTTPITPGFPQMNMPFPPSNYSTDPTGAPAYASHDGGSRRRSPQAPPRHRHERPPPGGPVAVAGPAYPQLPGMWNPNLPTASASGSPSTPSRGSDVSASILKARNPSADRTSSRSSGRGSGETALELRGGEPATLDASSVPQPRSPTSVHDCTRALAQETKPAETRSAPPERVQASSSEPTPFLDRLEIKITQSTPLVRVSASPASREDDAGKGEAARETVPMTVTGAEDFEGPIYASIRPPCREVASGSAPSVISDGSVASGTAEAAHDDFSQPVFASIRDSIAEPIRPENPPTSQDLSAAPLESVEASPEAAGSSSRGDNAATVTPGQVVKAGICATEESSVTSHEEPSSRNSDYEEPVFASIRPR